MKNTKTDKTENKQPSGKLSDASTCSVITMNDLMVLMDTAIRTLRIKDDGTMFSYTEESRKRVINNVGKAMQCMKIDIS